MSRSPSSTPLFDPRMPRGVFKLCRCGARVISAWETECSVCSGKAPAAHAGPSVAPPAPPPFMAPPPPPPVASSTARTPRPTVGIRPDDPHAELPAQPRGVYQAPPAAQPSEPSFAPSPMPSRPHKVAKTMIAEAADDYEAPLPPPRYPAASTAPAGLSLTWGTPPSAQAPIRWAITGRDAHGEELRFRVVWTGSAWVLDGPRPGANTAAELERLGLRTTSGG